MRRGEIVTAHFAHKHDQNSSCAGGGPETWQHKLAKQLLSDDLDKWQFVKECSGCNGQKGKAKRFLAKENYAGRIEYPYGRFSVDVMVLRNGVESAALEVRFTHAVDEQKRKYFEKHKIPIIEVEAEQVIDAYEDESFRVVVIEDEPCNDCERKKMLRNQRRCLQCENGNRKNFLKKLRHLQGMIIIPRLYAPNARILS